MNDAIIFFSMMGFITLVMAVILFMKGYKAFAIGIFTYILMTIGFTILLVHDRYWWAALVMTIWMIVSFPSVATKIGKWIERTI